MKYDANSIKSLDYRQACRERVEMYLGSQDKEGIIQGFREIVSNSIDEYSYGFGDMIEISYNSREGVFSVKDYGRGVPFGKREDGKEVLFEIFTKPHAGAKYDKDENAQYKNAIGANGIGASVTALTSTFFVVESYRDGKKATLTIKDGYAVKDIKIEKTSCPNGTSITWRPAKEVYKICTELPTWEEICNICKMWSYVCPHLTFKLTNTITKKETSYYSENGHLDLLNDKIGENIGSREAFSHKSLATLHCTPFTSIVQRENNTLELAFQWTNKTLPTYITIVNSLFVENGGTNITGFKNAITRVLNKKMNNKIDGDILRKGLVVVMNMKVLSPNWSDQTKNKINTPILRSMAEEAVQLAIDEFEQNNTTEFNELLELLQNVNKAEESAERARRAVININKQIAKQNKKHGFVSDKLKDCREHGENSMLILVEGDSAAGSMQRGRDLNNTAIMGLRGKIINALKSPLDKVFENAEVNDILCALGCGVMGNYNASKLRYGKVGIAVDGDDDGSSIATLIITLFYTLMPEFVRQGRLVLFKSPLYAATINKKTLFYYSDQDLTFAPKNAIINRMKGLGEFKPEWIKEAFFGSSRRLEILTMEDEKNFAAKLEILMGKSVEPRRKFVEENVNYDELEE